MARAGRAAHDRPHFYLTLDEFQNFATNSFTTILSEARKYGLALTLANQHLSQLREAIRDSILGNVASLVCFRTGSTDAEVLARELGGGIDAQQLTDLPRFEVAAKLMIGGRLSEPFLGKTVLLDAEHFGGGESIQRDSRQRFSTPVEKVEDRITRWFKQYEY